MVSYLALACMLFGATGLATASLSYVSYPVKIVFKSTKLIPTMIVSYGFTGKVYSVLDYVSAVLLCIGTSLFVYHPPESAAETSLIGVALLVCAVSCDAFVPNIQQSIMTHATAEEVMTNSNLVGLIGVSLYMLLHGDLVDVFEVLAVPGSGALLFSLAGVGMLLAGSVYCYTKLIKEAGPVVAVGVATVRKVASIICTYVIFPKPLSPVETLALAIIIAGIVFEVVKAKYKNKRNNEAR